MQAEFFYIWAWKKKWKYFFVILFSWPKLAFHVSIFWIFFRLFACFFFTGTFSVSYTGNWFYWQTFENFNGLFELTPPSCFFSQLHVLKKSDLDRNIRKRTRRWEPTYILHHHSLPAQLFFPFLEGNMHSTLSPCTFSRPGRKISLLEAK